MRDLITEALGQLATLVIGLIVFAWWIGGPGATAILWSTGEKDFALQFLAAWATVTVLYLTASRLIRRALRARRA
jgi:membrane protein implicated in regulation of membrane protease activity